jgi:hypothetical protein
LWNIKVKKGKAILVAGRDGSQGCETLRLPHFLDNRLTGGSEVVSLMCPPASLYPQGRFLVIVSVRDWVDPRAIVQLEGLGKLKNPVTSSGFKPVTFRLVASRVPQPTTLLHAPYET